MRENANSLVIEGRCGPRVRIFANEKVEIEQSAVDELVSLLGIEETISRLLESDPSYFGDGSPGIERVAVTPDFHKGAGVPIGTVIATRDCFIPQAVGSDVNCGMRLHITDYNADVILSHLNELETIFRHVFFRGGRDIPMTRIQREALFKEGLVGLLSVTPKDFRCGLWEIAHELGIENDLKRIHGYGSFEARTTVGLDDFIGRQNEITRDGQIGSIGGGNHFVEIQVVDKILDGVTAHAWGLKLGQVVVMIHTGSVAIGHLANMVMMETMKGMFPKGIAVPQNGIFVVPTSGKHLVSTERIRASLNNAANFAFANRMFLGLMTFKSLRSVCGESAFPLLYDAPHNFVWQEKLDGKDVFLHRKGATPARGFEEMADTPFAYCGEPTLVPGSMGSSSFILAGRGNIEALSSASHGAGRSTSRQKARQIEDHEIEEFMKRFRIVTPTDLRDPMVRMRRDIVEKVLNDIKSESPFVYKGIGPVIETLTDANIAQPVVELKPLLTIKS